ncbi:malonyl-CoA decarboxylase [Klebsormidium nitens]|uniref:Malonyl-CoA decarboxylase n=1 Tax=Klebsormidium nitens TaxID=105231 RepID=A0A1Y1HL36_KLENI|nr:malonyl-CoA decarboxylase [Klebsormidium nitens]|eukprot:GAQ79324.1 malonyl-CoA decarboxylase [Klebsormidium nitens]
MLPALRGAFSRQVLQSRQLHLLGSAVVQQWRYSSTRPLSSWCTSERAPDFLDDVVQRRQVQTVAGMTDRGELPPMPAWGAAGVTTLMHQAVKLDNAEMAAATLKQLRQDYLALPPPERRESLLVLAKEFGVDRGSVSSSCAHYLKVQADVGSHSTAESQATLLHAERELRKALNPLAGRLFEALHNQTGGLRFLSDMRADLLQSIRATNDPFLRNLDSVLKEKLSTWLGPAYLELRRLTWDSPASVLAKVAEHEQVHPIRSVQDLQQRLGAGCRLFGYFHPSMPGEPLIFVEVALLDKLAATMQEVAAPQADEEKARAAIFYSIDATQPGLSGIDLGNLLLKGVVQILRAELPNLEIFSTLSPVPGFLPWLRPKLALHASLTGDVDSSFAEELLYQDEAQAILRAVLPAKLVEDSSDRTLHAEACGCLASLLFADGPDWVRNPVHADALQGPLMRLCARYIYKEKKRGKALDGVTNFHVRNGATVERLNWLADDSPLRMESSAGIMVNYQYRFDTIEKNNKAYLMEGTIAASEQFLAFVHRKSSL